MPHIRGFRGHSPDELDQNGMGGYDPQTGLPYVSDPQQTFSDISRDQYLRYRENFEGFENQLLERAQTDTSLIDSAVEDSEMAQEVARGIQSRNLSRYGGSLTPAQQQQLGQTRERQGQLGSINALSNARIAQRDANNALLADVVNIGRGISRGSLSQLQSAAQNAQQRQNAFRQAQTAADQQKYSTIGAVGGAALFFLAGL